MKFVAISDTHCRHYSIHLPDGDVLIHAGDFTNRGQKDETVDFLDWFQKQDYQFKILVAGNHDFCLEKLSGNDLKKLLPENIIYLNDSGTSVHKMKIWGSPVTPWFYNWAFNRHRGEEIRKHWMRIPPETDILITHGPPKGILDTIINGQHVGCRDLLQMILLIQPKVHVFGHVHESYGKTKKKNIQFINACVVNEFYELSNKPVTFEL